MKAKDLKVGEAYRAEYAYGKTGKVTLVEAPVVRMERMRAGAELRPYRNDGHADGARVKVASTGQTVDVALTKVLYVWDAEDEAREAAIVDLRERVAAVRAKLDELGMPYERVWRGERSSSPANCTVALPFEALEAWLRRVDPVAVAGDAIDAFVEALDRSGHNGLSDGAAEQAKAAAIEEVVQGFAVSDAEISP